MRPIKIASTQYVRSFKILTKRDKNSILLVTILQIFMGFLDLLGVLAIGLAGALLFGGINYANPNSPTLKVLDALNLVGLTIEKQATILGIVAVVFLVGRTMLSIFFTRRIMFFFSQRGARISADLISRILSQSLLVIQSRSTQETVYATTIGVERLVLQVLASSVVCISDLSLLLVMMIGLLLIDPGTAVTTFSIFFLSDYTYISICMCVLGC